MDLGGYVKCDFSTASNLLTVIRLLIKKYGVDIDKIHDEAEDSRDLERRLLEFKGVGPTAVNIFLRELRSIWVKADPPISKYVLIVKDRLGLSIEDTRKYEPNLVKIFIEYCKRRKCSVCPLNIWCKGL